jgi:hypothetical protein
VRRAVRWRLRPLRRSARPRDSAVGQGYPDTLFAPQITHESRRNAYIDRTYRTRNRWRTQYRARHRQKICCVRHEGGTAQRLRGKRRGSRLEHPSIDRFCPGAALRRVGRCLGRICRGTSRDSFGGLDVVVNSAGILYLAKIHEMTVEHWDRVLAVNLRRSWSFRRHCRTWTRAGHRG